MRSQPRVLGFDTLGPLIRLMTAGLVIRTIMTST